MNIYSVQTQSLVDFIIFLCQSKMFCLAITKTLKRYRSSSPVTAAKKITVIYFVQCLSGDFQEKKTGVFNSSATKENKRISINEIRRQN